MIKIIFASFIFRLLPGDRKCLPVAVLFIVPGTAAFLKKNGPASELHIYAYRFAPLREMEVPVQMLAFRTNFATPEIDFPVVIDLPRFK